METFEMHIKIPSSGKLYFEHHDKLDIYLCPTKCDISIILPVEEFNFCKARFYKDDPSFIKMPCL